jgi:hypothetical protein
MHPYCARSSTRAAKHTTARRQYFLVEEVFVIGDVEPLGESGVEAVDASQSR